MLPGDPRSDKALNVKEQVAADSGWKTQLNESSKMWCFYEGLPEANHNALEGYTYAEEISQRTTVVFLWSASLRRQVALRYDFTQRVLEKAGATLMWRKRRARGCWPKC